MLGDYENIVKFYGWVEKPHCILMVLEYVKGGDLNNYIKKDLLSVKQKVKIILDIAKGLKYLHEKKIIHRDMKPANVAIDKIIGNDLDFTAKIYDFGVSNFESNSAPTTGITGTCRYRAPEQAHGKLYDLKVDIFSFAILSFEIFAEQTVYTDNKYKRLNETQLLLQIRQKGLRPDKNMSVREDTPEEIKEMLKRNWEHDPEKRMTSDELVLFLNDVYSKL
jgi:serine/threonine protein kinase